MSKSMTPPPEKKGHPPKLLIDGYGHIQRVGYESSNYQPLIRSEKEAIVEAVNSHDALMKQRDELREAVKAAMDVQRYGKGEAHVLMSAALLHSEPSK